MLYVHMYIYVLYTSRLQWLASSIANPAVVSSTLDNGKCWFSFFVKKMSIFILFQNLYYLFETYISMKLIMMDDLDMRVHKKVYIFLKDQYK